MVVVRKAEWIYWPLAPEGLARTTASIREVRFSRSFSCSKLTLPMGTWMMAVRSRRNSTRPLRASPAARDLSQAAYLAHHIGGGHGHIKVQEPLFYFLHQFVCPHHIGPGLLGGL